MVRTFHQTMKADHPMFAKLADVLLSRYDVTVANSPVEAILWAADHLLLSEPVEVVKRELSAMNRQREKLGKRPAYAAFGHPLF